MCVGCFRSFAHNNAIVGKGQKFGLAGLDTFNCPKVGKYCEGEAPFPPSLSCFNPRKKYLESGEGGGPVDTNFDVYLNVPPPTMKFSFAFSLG